VTDFVEVLDSAHRYSRAIFSPKTLIATGASAANAWFTCSIAMS
jgi:hypothetical protein